MHRKSFKFKIIIPTVVILVALVVSINIFLSIRFSSIGQFLINEKLSAITNSLDFYLNESEAKSNVAATSMALNSGVIKAVREHDTEELLHLFNVACNTYRIDYFAITDGEGNVLARTHDPENKLDSIAYLQNIKDSLEGRVSSYYESGNIVRVSVHTGSPVYDTDGTLIGTISAGVRFDLDSKVEDFKGLFNSEITIFLGDTSVATTITKDGQRVSGLKLNASIADIVYGDKKEYMGDAEILGERYKAFYKPLINFKDEVFAVIAIGIPMAELQAETNNSIRNGIILGLCGLALSIIILYLMISSISQPIAKVSREMTHIANGNLNIAIDAKGDDEVGNLEKSLKKVAETLQKLLSDINETIGEHEKGNIEYFLDAEDFLGDYRILAENIIELASFGIRDQLTGIPNRRTFDNRLDMEWERATRAGIPLSVLILDVDKFKNYNDAFGHQQGDMALQTVGKVIKQSLKRPIDFCARWGGEEFIVLLPDTDSAGAKIIAERIRAEIESSIIPCSGEDGKRITVSIGVGTQIPLQDSNVDDFIATADAALYKAKETGRNKVVINEENA
ncbi:MAG: diguanylate cyclase [Clostridiales bacterium]|nr:diguanylate cyclase [Clostridiales bacterium]